MDPQHLRVRIANDPVTINQARCVRTTQPRAHFIARVQIHDESGAGAVTDPPTMAGETSKRRKIKLFALTPKTVDVPRVALSVEAGPFDQLSKRCEPENFIGPGGNADEVSIEEQDVVDVFRIGKPQRKTKTVGIVAEKRLQTARKSEKRGLVAAKPGAVDFVDDDRIATVHADESTRADS